MILAEIALGTEPKPKSATRKRRRRPSTEEIIDYVVEIENWDWSYWLALNTLRQPFDPYHEHRHVEIKGRLLRPTGLQTDLVEVSLFPSISLTDERRSEPTPTERRSVPSFRKKCLQNAPRSG